MAKITTPQGKEFEETGKVALAYYRNEPGYKVDGEDTAEPLEADKPVAVTLAKSSTSSPAATPPPPAPSS